MVNPGVLSAKTMNDIVSRRRCQVVLGCPENWVVTCQYDVTKLDLTQERLYLYIPCDIVIHFDVKRL